MVAVLEASPRRRMRAPHLLRPFALMIVVLLVVGMATAPLARRISRPVERLTEATRRLGEGDLSYRIPIHPRWRARWKGRHGHHHHAIDELEQLTCGFNDMAERVEQLVRGQKELLANVSHELRSPLARLRMALELLPRDPSGESEARLKDLELDIGELDRLIEEVLTMSRLDASRLPLHVEPVEARALLAQLALRARHDPALQGKEVLLAEGPPVELEADGALVKRALWNLIENAGKYGAAPITLAAVRDGAEVLLSVSDEGAGISAEERERVFAPFYRVERAHTPGRGFGLGLALARRVAEVHGGSIRAEGAHPAEGGRAERGCRVVIALPAKASATTG
jgi:signal transduction histidine kinase